MDAIRTIAWLLSFALHAALLVAFVRIACTPALESSSGDDIFTVEQGNALEELAKLGELPETIEAVDISRTQEKVEAQVAEDIKPVLASIISSMQGDDVGLPDLEKPVEVHMQEEAAEITTLIQPSSGAEQHGTETTEHGTYLGQLRYIVPVTVSKVWAVSFMTLPLNGTQKSPSISDRPEIGALLAIETASTVVLAICSALSDPIPAREGDSEIWIAELQLVGALQRDAKGRPAISALGDTIYPSRGDKVRITSKSELEAFCGDLVDSDHLKTCALNHIK